MLFYFIVSISTLLFLFYFMIVNCVKDMMIGEVIVWTSWTFNTCSELFFTMQGGSET